MIWWQFNYLNIHATSSFVNIKIIIIIIMRNICRRILMVKLFYKYLYKKNEAESRIAWMDVLELCFIIIRIWMQWWISWLSRNDCEPSWSLYGCSKILSAHKKEVSRWKKCLHYIDENWILQYSLYYTHWMYNKRLDLVRSLKFKGERINCSTFYLTICTYIGTL